MSQKERVCPECQATIPIYASYITWCDQCGWNLQPYTPKPPRNVFESLYVSIGRKQGQKLFDEMVKSKSLKPALTFSKAIAFGFAAIIHGFTLAFVILGLVLLINGWPNPVAIFGGLLCLGIAWIMFPHLDKMPDRIMPRDKFPTLYKIVGQVAQALNTSDVDGIVIDWQFNAAFWQVGWRRQKILYLGLPLFSILNSQERVAVLAHELAHGVNGDPNRGFFVGSAIQSLAEWHNLSHPNTLVDLRAGIFSLLTIPLNLFMALLARLIWLLAYLISHLLWHDSQRAEYLADYLAADVAGSEAMRSVLRKLHAGEAFIRLVKIVSLSPDKPNLFDKLQQHIVNMPQRELERIKRVEQLQESRLDMTHPPTAHRIGFLEAQRVSEPKLVISPADMEKLDEELKPLQEKIQDRLAQLYKNGLYY